MTALKPVIAAKQYGHEDALASLVADAALSVMPPNPKNFNVDNVRVVKIMGGSLAASKVVQGMVFGREPEGVSKIRTYVSCRPLTYVPGDVKKVYKAKVAVFTSALDVAQTETKGTVLIKNADEMLNFTAGEEKHMEKVASNDHDKNVLLISITDLQRNRRLWCQSHRRRFISRGTRFTLPQQVRHRRP